MLGRERREVTGFRRGTGTHLGVASASSWVGLQRLRGSRAVPVDATASPHRADEYDLVIVAQVFRLDQDVPPRTP
jgi:hypothetical protein